MKKWHPRPDDLTPYMYQVMEAAYEERERPRCSRDDFFDGFMNALVMLRSRSSFRSSAWQESVDEDASAR